MTASDQAAAAARVKSRHSDHSNSLCINGFAVYARSFLFAKIPKLVWVMKTTTEANEFWAIAGTPCENETVFEVSFNFQNLTVEIIPIVFSERTEPNKYQSELKSWKENHELLIPHDDYGRVIPNDYKELWNQFVEVSDSYLENTASDLQIPKLETKNKFLVFINKFLESETFWITFWGVGFSLIIIAFIVIIIYQIKFQKIS